LKFPLSLWFEWFEQAKGASLEFNLLLKLHMCCMLVFLDFATTDIKPEVCFEEDWGDVLLTAASVRMRVVGVNELACVLTRGGEVLRAGALWDKGSDDFLEYLIQYGWQALSISLSLLVPLNFPLPWVELLEAYLYSYCFHSWWVLAKFESWFIIP
jgi:hypothetical protein